MKDPRTPYMEQLSDKVRMGEPIDFLDAIAVINYQATVRAWREYSKPWARVKRWFKGEKS